MNIERLVKLAGYLEALPRNPDAKLGFNMRSFYSLFEFDQGGGGCQSTACIAGHAVALFTDYSVDESRDIELDARDILELDELEACDLFYPKVKHKEAKPAAAAQAIYRLIAGEKPWP